MLIDFKEIPVANSGGGLQDTFELFVRDFLEGLGYKIVVHPDRGADGQKDMIVEEERKGIAGITKIRWIVSCKHFAPSGKAVSDSKEQDIIDRVETFGCSGFMGVYSTLASSGLNNKLRGLNGKIEYKIYDRETIESNLMGKKELESLIARFFPKSFERIRGLNIPLDSKESEKFNRSICDLTENDLFHLIKSAVGVISFDEIRYNYFRAPSDQRDEIFNQIFKYSNIFDYRMASEIIDFLSVLSSETRSGMTKNLASSIFSAVIEFGLPLHLKTYDEKAIDLAKQCIQTGFNIASHALIYLKDLEIAMYGLTIIKFVYRSSKHSNTMDISIAISETYEALFRQLKIAELADIDNAQDLIETFKTDLETPHLAFPPLSKKLMKEIYKDY